MIKLLLISRECVESSRRGGIASANNGYIRMLNERGIFVVELVAREPNVFTKIIGNLHYRHAIGLRDYSLRKLKLMKVFRLGYYFLYRFNVLLYVLKNYDDFDVIEVADYGAEGVLLLPFKNIRRKLVVRGHTVSALSRETGRIRIRSLNHFMEVLQLRLARRVVCCSETLSLVYKNELGIRVSVLYNPIEFEETHTGIQSANRKGILYLGTISKAKGSDLLLRCSTLYDFSVTMAGRQSSNISFTKNERVNYLGLLSENEVKILLTSYKVIIVPSLFENLPMVVVEAMRCGILVIAADNSGMRELLCEGEYGFLYPTYSVDDMYAAINRGLSLSDNEYDSIVNKAKVYIKNVAGYEAVFAKWQGLFLG